MYMVTKNKKGYNVASGEIKDKFFINSFGYAHRIGFQTILFETLKEALEYVKGELNGKA